MAAADRPANPEGPTQNRIENDIQYESYALK